MLPHLISAACSLQQTFQLMLRWICLYSSLMFITCAFLYADAADVERDTHSHQTKCDDTSCNAVWKNYFISWAGHHSQVHHQFRGTSQAWRMDRMLEEGEWRASNCCFHGCPKHAFPGRHASNIKLPTQTLHTWRRTMTWWNSQIKWYMSHHAHMFHHVSIFVGVEMRWDQITAVYELFVPVAREFASLLRFDPQDLEPYTKYHPFDFEDSLSWQMIAREFQGFG